MEVSANSFKITTNLRGERALQFVYADRAMLVVYSPGCPHCPKAIEQVKLACSRTGVKMAIMDATSNMDFIRDTVGTTTPINEVPFILNFVNGMVNGRYVGPYESETIITFIVSGALPIPKDSDSVDSKEPLGVRSSRAGPTCTVDTIYQPVCTSNVCYMPL